DQRVVAEVEVDNVAQQELTEFDITFITIERCRTITTQSAGAAMLPTQSCPGPSRPLRGFLFPARPERMLRTIRQSERARKRSHSMRMGSPPLAALECAARLRRDAGPIGELLLRQACRFSVVAEQLTETQHCRLQAGHLCSAVATSF